MFNVNKVVFPPVPYYVGSYKFNVVKSSLEFIKELEIFHFGEKIFHRNDSQGKVVALKDAHKVNFKYANYIDKQEHVFKNVYSMAALSKWLNKKEFGAKGSSNNDPRENEGDEEATKKSQEENTRTLAAREKRLLVEEAQKDWAKVAKQNSIEVVLKKMAEWEKALVEGD